MRLPQGSTTTLQCTGFMSTCTTRTPRRLRARNLRPPYDRDGATLASSRDWGTLGFAMWSGGQDGMRASGEGGALSSILLHSKQGPHQEEPVVSIIKRALVSPVVGPSLSSHIITLSIVLLDRLGCTLSISPWPLLSSQAPPPKQPRCWQCFSTRTSWARIRLMLS